MRWVMTHGITLFAASLALFAALAIAMWIAIGFVGAFIVALVAAIWGVFALPPLIAYYDDHDNPASGRYPDALQ
jgi:dolichol kinase